MLLGEFRIAGTPKSPLCKTTPEPAGGSHDLGSRRLRAGRFGPSFGPLL